MFFECNIRRRGGARQRCRKAMERVGTRGTPEWRWRRGMSGRISQRAKWQNKRNFRPKNLEKQKKIIDKFLFLRQDKITMWKTSVLLLEKCYISTRQQGQWAFFRKLWFCTNAVAFVIPFSKKNPTHQNHFLFLRLIIFLP